MSDSGSPSTAKRKRIDSSESGPPIRSKIWMSYGDIILQAESTQFRVNRDILANQSSVFRDMFSLPQPPGEDTVEGCLIVELSDSAKDVELLLTALYDPYHNKSKQSIDMVACMLRLGRKYDISSLKNDAISRMHRGFPTTLDAFDKCISSQSSAPFGGIQSTPGLLIDLLNLAYENGVHTSIPTIGLNCLVKYSLETLFPVEPGAHIILPDSIKLTLALALERIQIFQKENLGWLTHNEVLPSPACEDPYGCSQVRDEMAHLDLRRDKLDVTYFIHPWLLVGEGMWQLFGLCEACENAAKDQHNVGRLRAWERLPVLFGLPEWKDLKDAY
ncbi:hypothetical protein B0H17DRAFT_1339515 [Mycena rosella]|uniref:BTB domain-containing protein n=1 Tax=Mycena rosella TaxID=1033263 RepID=A0AAD7C2Z7_MYCRO|nr:hypothetical protein B0H17DRAFT_1339515 [Mycena rosella]